MLRILKPEGMVLWYDYHMNNPGNPDVRGGKELEKIPCSAPIILELSKNTTHNLYTS
jgi:hypothetical protein